VDLVVALSHTGVEDDGTGEDATIATNVNGMDIIASGHYHTADATPPTVNGALIISPGSYGKYVGRLDITYNPTTETIVGSTFNLIPIDDSVPGIPAIQGMVDTYNAGINAVLFPALEVNLDTILSTTAFDLNKADYQVTGYGSLCADSLRNVANAVAPYNFGTPVDIGIVASGTTRDGIYAGNTGAITFSDAYNALPLGASPFDPSLPGYPLMSIYAYGYEVQMICEVGMTISHMFGPDFFLNFSGLQIVYNTTIPQVQSVNVYNPADVFCLGPAMGFPPPAPINPMGLYHIAVGYYELQMINVISPLLPPPGIVPKKADGTPLLPTEYGSARIDASPSAGVQELKEWLALVQYIGGFGGGLPGLIYAPGGLATGDLRVDYLP
jgi:UDP-sugar diphosphatase